MTLDGLTALGTIAARVSALPHGRFPTVSLGTASREAVDFLATHPSAERRTFRTTDEGPPRMITHVRVELGGVEFTASVDREPTAEEERAHREALAAAA